MVLDAILAAVLDTVLAAVLAVILAVVLATVPAIVLAPVATPAAVPSAILASAAVLLAAAIVAASIVAASVVTFAETAASLDFETELQSQMLMSPAELKWTAVPELLLDVLSIMILLDLKPVAVQCKSVLIQGASGNDSPLESNTSRPLAAIESHVHMEVPLISKKD
ncbi:MAG: hypothetical protein M1839_002016 [Geoglossum umbratile]|nr:MAG: hypothetical protein M1839_002016 [Geoglossum umbratile]